MPGNGAEPILSACARDVTLTREVSAETLEEPILSSCERDVTVLSGAPASARGVSEPSERLSERADVPERYRRNLKALSADECAALGRASVLVVGCGGLGGYVIESLVRIGVGNIIALDCDVFEETNLNRQVLATRDTLGVPKAQAAVQRAALVNPSVQVTPLVERLDGSNAHELVRDADCVVDALDNVDARRCLARACQDEGVVLIHGAVAGWYGQVCAVHPGDASFSALYCPADSGASSSGGIEKTEGVLPFTCAAVASYQAAEVVKALIGRGDALRNRLLIIDTLSASADEIPLA